ncbi:CBS domain-containing protein [Falsiroseomonas sp.]|uniref:CBS domain-containing protein n=1 Tax=Falsiroseomonas sp. TaxID=2870721 RepID=UPI00356372A7
MKVKDLMTSDPVVVPPDMPVEALVRLLAERHVSGVFVVDADGTPVGVVTEADLVRRLAPEGEEADLGWLERHLVDPDRAAARYARAHGRLARDVMSRTLVFVDEDAPAEEATQLMRERRIRRVAVMRWGRLIGVVSRADLLKAVVGADALGAETADERIRRAILEEMRRQPWADTRLTIVSVAAGVVRLEGYCRSEEARRAMQVLAERVAGVQRIENRLQLGPAGADATVQSL